MIYNLPLLNLYRKNIKQIFKVNITKYIKYEYL